MRRSRSQLRLSLRPGRYRIHNDNFLLKGHFGVIRLGGCGSGRWIVDCTMQPGCGDDTTGCGAQLSARGGRDQLASQNERELTEMRRYAFTLVELLIVVIILGILAAVVIPQFSDASTDARVSSLTTNLSTIRGQLEFYKMQHNSNYPTDNTTFTAQMTAGTDISGAAGTDFGPYLQRVPNNPFTNTNTISATSGSGSAWYYDGATGEFLADDGGSEGGTAHNTY